jgi:hypothetical protein
MGKIEFLIYYSKRERVSFEIGVILNVFYILLLILLLLE